MFKNATSRQYFIHLGLATGVFLMIAYLFFYVWLPALTKHGETILVPNFNSKTVNEAMEIAAKVEIKIQIFDSSYAPAYLARTVITQFPKAGEFVKSQRTIYVSISTMFPPQIKMPKLIGSSQKSAEMTLKSYGLKLGYVSRAYSVHEGEVLRQLYGSSSIVEGSAIAKGSVIDLVVSAGLSSERTMIPNLVGLSYDSARTLLAQHGLDAGSVVYEGSQNLSTATVMRQKPSNNSNDSTISIRMGEIIDLWLSTE